MAGPARSGIFIYAKYLRPLADFYRQVIGMTVVTDSEDMVVLEQHGLQLVVHAIPADIAAQVDIQTPPVKRDNTAIKFFVAVPSIDQARQQAAALGGAVFEENWTGPGFLVCNAMDPEGNVFQVREFADTNPDNG